MSTVIFDSKVVEEEVTLVFDFLSRLKPGETVLTCTVTVQVESGVDPSPALFAGMPSNTTTQVSVPIQGGLPGVIYKFFAAARTSDANVYVNVGSLAVLPGDPAATL